MGAAHRRTAAIFDADLARIFTLFPRLARTARTTRRHAVGRRAADAGDRARHLMSRPRLLLLDEPSLGPRPRSSPGRFFEVIRTLNVEEKLTVFLVEQERVFMPSSSPHRGYVMVNGRITLSGSGRELLGTRRGSRPPISKADAKRLSKRLIQKVDPKRWIHDGLLHRGIFLRRGLVRGFPSWFPSCSGGGAALARPAAAIAATWRPWWHVAFYMLILGLAVRFLHFALFGATLLSPHYYLVDARGLPGARFFSGFRAARAGPRWRPQYRWNQTPAPGAFAWGRRQLDPPGHEAGGGHADCK